MRDCQYTPEQRALLAARTYGAARRQVLLVLELRPGASTAQIYHDCDEVRAARLKLVGKSNEYTVEHLLGAMRVEGFVDLCANRWSLRGEL